MHNGRIDFGGEKMSKSLGNVLWAKDLLKQVPHQVYRLLILNVPYRQPLNYKEDLLKQATNDYEKIKRAYISLFRKLEVEKEDLGREELTNNELVNLKQEFINAMSNDFNTANAITSIFQLTKMVNNYVRNKETNVSDMKQALGLFLASCHFLTISNSSADNSLISTPIPRTQSISSNNPSACFISLTFVSLFLT